MLQFLPVLQYTIPKENKRHVIRNVRKLLNGALVGNVEIDAMGSMGVNVTSSATDADLVFVITANQLQRTPCIMLSATRGTEPSAKLIIDLTVIAGGGDGTPLTGITGKTGMDSTVPGVTGKSGTDGSDSTVVGPVGKTGMDSTVASTVPGVTGKSGTDGSDSTVVGPVGKTGADSTVASTVPGVTGKSGTDGSDSTVVGPVGKTGADSTVPGPPSTTPGPTGKSGQGRF